MPATNSRAELGYSWKIDAKRSRLGVTWSLLPAFGAQVVDQRFEPGVSGGADRADVGPGLLEGGGGAKRTRDRLSHSDAQETIESPRRAQFVPAQFASDRALDRPPQGVIPGLGHSTRGETLIDFMFRARLQAVQKGSVVRQTFAGHGSGRHVADRENQSGFTTPQQLLLPSSTKVRHDRCAGVHHLFGHGDAPTLRTPAQD